MATCSCGDKRGSRASSADRADFVRMQPAWGKVVCECMSDEECGMSIKLASGLAGVRSVCSSAVLVSQ